MKTYYLLGDDETWIFGVRGNTHNSHVWEVMGDRIFCSCIYWNAPIGKEQFPLALANCYNCDGHGLPPVPPTEIDWS